MTFTKKLLKMNKLKFVKSSWNKAMSLMNILPQKKLLAEKKMTKFTEMTAMNLQTRTLNLESQRLIILKLMSWDS